MLRKIARSFIAAFPIAAATLLRASDAEAFCRSTTCDDSHGSLGQCNSTTEGCIPLVWRRQCVGWTIHHLASKKVSYQVAETALLQAFGSWQFASCGSGIRIENMGPVNCDQVQYNDDAGNANVIVFRDASWPHDGQEHNIGLTTVTFDPKTGEILDADIEVNTAQFDFTWDDTTVTYDLVSVLTHEVGHFLGLSHSEDSEATMFSSYDRGTITFRDLSTDDNNAICEAYPTTVDAEVACNPIPRHGFASDCKSSQKEGKCSAAGGSGLPGADASAAFAFGLVAASALLRSARVRRTLKAGSASRPTPSRPRALGPHRRRSRGGE